MKHYVYLLIFSAFISACLLSDSIRQAQCVYKPSLPMRNGTAEAWYETPVYYPTPYSISIYADGSRDVALDGFTRR